MSKTFPDGFFWGAATASYQVEGGIENNDWAKAARDGRVPECGEACDHYHRYIEDFDLAKSLGHSAHRFSLEWARIEPREGEFDATAIDHYRRVIRALKDRNIKPIMTLWHFTLPEWLAAKGGFESPESPALFARYAKKVVEELGDEVEMVTTMNEPIVFASIGWLKGNWPPFKQFSLGKNIETTNSGDRTRSRPHTSVGVIFTYRKVVGHLAAAHNEAYTAIKAVQPHIDVSLVKHTVAFEANWNPINKFKAWFGDMFLNHSFLRNVHKHCDSFGLNYYHYKKYGDTQHYRKTDMDWEFAPEQIRVALRTLWKYKKPIFVSEAGLADHDDSDRAEYIQKQVAGTWHAIQDGVDVRGHLYWSLLDNYEWALGFEKRFGLIEVNYNTQKRTIRPSAYVYKEICEKNAVVEYKE